MRLGIAAVDTEPMKDIQPIVLRGTVDRYEGDYAIIVLDEGGEVLWPKARLAEGARPGAIVVLAMAADRRETARREQEVRHLLRDIFGAAPDGR